MFPSPEGAGAQGIELEMRPMVEREARVQRMT
jgi:hypothetical protein